MKERPILFSGEMVRAILAGRKTQTRRLARVTRVHATGGTLDYTYVSTGRGTCVVIEPATGAATAQEISHACPYGVPGDRLWVRETLRQRPDGSWGYVADDAPVTLPDGDPRVPAMLAWAHHKEGLTCVSIHMPRWASRLTLEIESVRVERIQDIMTGDIWSEGIDVPPVSYDVPDDPRMLDAERDAEARRRWREGWDRINGKRAPWASNPWVWAITFRRVP